MLAMDQVSNTTFAKRKREASKHILHLVLNLVLIDPLNKLREIFATRDVNAQDLVEALRSTKEDVDLM